jgi:hypothetical protein
VRLCDVIFCSFLLDYINFLSYFVSYFETGDIQCKLISSFQYQRKIFKSILIKIIKKNNKKMKRSKIKVSYNWHSSADRDGLRWVENGF